MFRDLAESVKQLAESKADAELKALLARVELQRQLSVRAKLER